MGIIRVGVDFNGDGSADGFMGCVVGGPESVCGKTFLPCARLLLEKYLDLPNGPCVLLRCGFCKQDSVAYVDCPWCGAKGTWRHNRNIKFNSGWLECSRCLKQLGDNPCPKCSKTNDILNFHLLMYASEEEQVAKLKDEEKQSRGLLGRVVRGQLERFIYVVTPHPFLLGPVNKQWLMARVGEDPANMALQFSNSPEGPWESAKDMLDFGQRILKLKPLPGGSKLPNSAASTASFLRETGDHLSGGGVTKAAPPVVAIDQYWVRTPQGKRGGPFTKEQIAKAIATGKIPADSEAATSPDGPWRRIRAKTDR